MHKRQATARPAFAGNSAPATGRSREAAFFAVWLIGLIAALAWAYAPGLNAPFLLDDRESIVENPTLRQLHTAFLPPTGSGVTVSGRPLLNFTLAANYLCSGANPIAFRITNLCIHLANTLLLFGIVRRTLLLPRFRQRLGPRSFLLAGCIASLWSLHPLNTEAVTYVVQRAESLVALCYLLFFYCFLRRVSGGAIGWLVAAWITCLAGMNAKEVMVSAPIGLFFFDACFVSESYSAAYYNRKRFYWALGATWLWLAFLIWTTSGRGGSVGGDHSVSSLAYLCTQAKAILLYLRLAVWPASLVFDYGTLVESNALVIVACGVGVVALLAASFYGLKRGALAGFLGTVFFLVLAPSSSVVPIVTQTIAEHRMYLPLAAVIAVIVGALDAISRRSLIVSVGIAAIALTVVTHARNGVYRTAIELWTDTLAKQPINPRAHNNLGDALLTAQRPAEAIEEFKRALAIKPDLVEARTNLGLALLFTGDVNQALKELEIAQAHAPTNAAVLVNYGNALLEAGRPDEAMNHLRKALELNPHVAGGYYNLANALRQVGQADEARAAYEHALQENPNDAEAHTNYGALLRDAGQLDEAVTHCRTALELKPDSPIVRNNLGIALLMRGSFDEGVAQLKEALRLQPTSVETRLNLGAAYAQNGRTAEALEQFEAALPYAPASADLHNNIGVLYAQAGRYSEAQREFEAALKIDPDHPRAQQNLSALQSGAR